MSLWGNADDKTSTGTVAIAAAVVTGIATLFDTESKPGDFIKITDTGDEAVIVSISSNTAMVIDRDLTVVAANNYTLNEKPHSIRIDAKGTTANSVFGVDTTEMGIAGVSADTVQHAGWVKIVDGTGPVNSVTITAGGTAFDAGVDTITFAAPELAGGVTATGTLVVAANVVTAVTMTNNGSGYSGANSAPFSLGGGVGTGETFVVVFGGRANRRSTETLVAMGTITGDAVDDGRFPDA